MENGTVVYIYMYETCPFWSHFKKRRGSSLAGRYYNGFKHFSTTQERYLDPAFAAGSYSPAGHNKADFLRAQKIRQCSCLTIQFSQFEYFSHISDASRMHSYHNAPGFH